MALPVNFTYFLDGTYYPIKGTGIPVSNRAFKYGDFIFETVHTKASQPLMLDYHLERLRRGMTVLKLETTQLPSLEQLHKYIESLINKNRYYADCRVRITVFRKGEGLYTPLSNEASLLIEATPLEFKGYPWREKGFLVDLYTDNVKGLSPINNFKCGNSLVSVLACAYKLERDLGDVLLLNHNNRIIEASSSNLFWVKGERFFTPKLSSGCVDGVMRRKTIELMKANKYELVETDGVTPEVLEWADEIFLTNAISGIQSVIGYKLRRYYRVKTKQLSDLLNAWYKDAR